ncbi:MAG: PaaI family thioesterase [Candidatus Hydrogenedentes bacterium]|nr:PaaI family thioesterase [Candidatus Hydrogenedentota bacterium]
MEHPQDNPPLKGSRHLDQLQRLVRGEVEGPPIAALIGFRPTHVEHGHTVFEMEADRRHANPMGTLHGGVICDFADAAMGFAMASTLRDDESFTTLDLNAKYFKPVWNARLRATAHVTRRTGTLGLIECEVTDESGSLVAKVFSTCMVLRGEKAAGR